MLPTGRRGSPRDGLPFRHAYARERDETDPPFRDLAEEDRINQPPAPRPGTRPDVSKGRRKRLGRRAAEVAAESAETRRAKRLARRVVGGLYEIRRRGNEEKNPNLDLPIFPIVGGLLAEIRRFWGEAAGREMRTLL